MKQPPDDEVEYLTEETNLTERQSEVWVYGVMLDRDEQLVAEQLGIEIGTVRSHKARAREKIQEARQLLEATALRFEHTLYLPGEE